jgi:hypothetical protein
LPVGNRHGMAAVRRQDVLRVRQILSKPGIEETDLVGHLRAGPPTAGSGDLNEGNLRQREGLASLSARGLQGGPFRRTARFLRVHESVHQGVGIAGEPAVGLHATGSMDLGPLAESVPVRSGIEQDQPGRVRGVFVGEDADVLRTERATHQHERWCQAGILKRQAQLLCDPPGVARGRTGIGAAGPRMVIRDDG